METVCESKEHRTYLVKNSIALAIAVIGFIIAFVAQPGDDGKFGAIGVIILLVPITYSFLTERMIEAFIIAGLIGAAFFSKGAFIMYYPYRLIETVADEDTLWVIIILGLMAGITQLLKNAGGMAAFVNMVSKKIKSRRGVLVLTWVTSLFFFFDDYLNCLLRGGTLKKLTDKHNISREYLTYIIDSTAASVCILVPISTWAVYVSGIFEMIGYAPEGEGISYFIKTIPFNFYAWTVLLISLLVAIGIIPIFGPMKKAEDRIKDYTQTQIEKYYGESVGADSSNADEENIQKNPRIINFVLPVLVITVVTILTDMDVLVGAFVGLIFTFFLFIAQKLISLNEFGQACLDGIKRMLQPIILLAVCFTCASYFMETGFSEWLASIVENSGLPLFLLPLTVFLFVAVFEFFAGGEWITYMIMMPIFIPLAMDLGANVNLVAAAIIAAGIFGSNICIIAEATILTSAAAGCSVVKHTVTQMPYGMIAAGLAVIGFAISGILL